MVKQSLAIGSVILMSGVAVAQAGSVFEDQRPMSTGDLSEATGTNVLDDALVGGALEGVPVSELLELGVVLDGVLVLPDVAGEQTQNSVTGTTINSSNAVQSSTANAGNTRAVDQVQMDNGGG